MFALVSKPVSLFGVALFFLAVPIWWHFYPYRAVAQVPGQGQAPAISAVDKRIALNRAGLDAKALAAAGVSSNAAGACAQAGMTYLLNHATAISSADAACSAARTECDRLQRLIQAGKGSSEDAASYATHKAALATAVSQRQTALDALYAAATANLSNEQKALLAALRANSAHSDIPVEFRTVERSKADWVRLRDDLANERISAKQGVAAYEVGQSRLATCRANATVAAAKTALDTNLASITTALHTAITGE